MTNLTYQESLTKKEFEVLELWARGYTAPQIAQELGNSARTIERHIDSIKAKTGCIDRKGAFNFFEPIYKEKIIDEYGGRKNELQELTTIDCANDSLSIAGIFDINSLCFVS